MPRLISRAKLNIGLHFTGRRVSDGYHYLESYFQEIDLADILTVKLNKDSEFRMTCTDPKIPVDGRNTVMKALEMLRPHLPRDLGAEIHLEKRIPHGAGLGGGSSNAAAVLNEFRKFTDLEDTDVHRFAVLTGADVPFFLKGGLQYVTGTGDILEPIDHKLALTFLLIIPEFQVATDKAYKLLNLPLTENLFPAKFAGFINQPISWEFFENEFEEVLIPAHPQIGEVKSRLLETGAVHAALSGSGSTVYGVYEEEALAENARDRLSGEFRCIISRPAER